MSVLVVLAVAVAVAAVGGVIVAALQLRQAAKRLKTGVHAAAARLEPLTAELQDEAAVTSVELESLQDAVTRLSASRREPRPPATAPLD